MNKEQTAKLIEVMQEYVDGKTIEFLLGNDWVMVSEPGWKFGTWEYRIKPEPREWTISVDKKGNAFSYEKGDELSPYYSKVRVREIID